MRFSIRDLLWATLVVAMGLAWWADHRRSEASRAELGSHARRLRESAVAAKATLDVYTRGSGPGHLPEAPFIDWSVLEEPLVEP
jgi:hypothetical protein